MSTTAVLFNPQVHVLPGHFRDLHDEIPAVRRRLAEASEVLGVDLVSEFFSDDEARINRGEVVRPASMAIALGLVDAGGIELSGTRCAAGISLGQITAASAVGALSFRDAVRMARTMALIEAEMLGDGDAGVAFYYNVELDGFVRVLDERRAGGADLAPCAYTADNQMIVSGEVGALRELCVAAVGHGGLGVVIPHGSPAHNPALEPVERRFATEWTYLDGVRDPSVPLLCNLTTGLLTTGEEVHEALVTQYTNTVRWSTGMHRLGDLGVLDVLVVGPGHFVRRSLDHTGVDLRVHTLGTPDDLRTARLLDAALAVRGAVR